MGDRLQQTVNGSPTRYVFDPSAGLTEVLADGTNTYLYGNDRLAQYQSAMQYFGPDGLGSVRQIYDASAQVVGSTRYDPYGNVMAQSGATSVFAFAGEQQDATGLTYLRARYYSSYLNQWIQPDPIIPNYENPQSLNRYAYVFDNPVNYTDPTGLQGCTAGGICPPQPNPGPPMPPPGTPPAAPDCYQTSEPEWNCPAQAYLHNLKGTLLASASRHNRPGSNIDNNALAGLIGALIVGEQRIGNPYSPSDAWRQQVEDWAIRVGCLTSGHLIDDAIKAGDWKTFMELTIGQILDTQTGGSVLPPQTATVGIGNVWLTTAMNLRRHRACSSLGECMSVDVQIRAPDIVPYPAPDFKYVWLKLGEQLLDDEINVEYLAANLEAGIIRAKWLKASEGTRDLGGPFDGPSVFNLTAWHAKGIQTDFEIQQLGWPPGHAIKVVDWMPLALRVLERIPN